MIEEGLEYARLAQPVEPLQLRLHPAASRVAELSGKFPARLIVFDLLADENGSLIDTPFPQRWEALKAFVKTAGEHQVVVLSKAVRSHAAARNGYRETATVLTASWQNGATSLIGPASASCENSTSMLRRHDSNKTASGKPGAVHG